MESHGVPGKIQVTERTYAVLRDRYAFVERGTIEVKGRDRMRTWFLEDRSADKPDDGCRHRRQG